MNLKDILLNPDKIKDLCCLCYKETEDLLSLHDDIEIRCENFNFNSSLHLIMKNLFPSHVSITFYIL